MARENDDNDTFVAKVVMVAMLNTAQVLEGRVKSLKQLTHVEVTSNKQSHDFIPDRGILELSVHVGEQIIGGNGRGYMSYLDKMIDRSQEQDLMNFS